VLLKPRTGLKKLMRNANGGLGSMDYGDSMSTWMLDSD